MEKMLFTINDIGHQRRTAVEPSKIDDDSLGSFRVMMPLAKYRLASEEILEETVEMIIKEVVSSKATTEVIPVIIDKIVDQGSRDHMYLPRI